MNLQLDDLTIKLTGIDLNDLCDGWQWLLPDIQEVLLISKLGDMFLKAKDGFVYWLATDSGCLTKIADSYREFEQMLNNEDNQDNWFLPLIIEELISARKLLGKNEVYSYKRMPVIGGEYAVDNIEPTDISVHFYLTGEICRQVKDLPDGTKVIIKPVD